jgi:hypothetical protein
VSTPNGPQQGAPNIPGNVFGFGGASIIGPILSSRGTYQDLGPITTTDEINSKLGDGVLPNLGGSDKVGYLFKDMGRSVKVVNSEGLAISIYHECQLVRGATTEGVPADAPEYGATYYVRVWEAAPYGEPDRGYARNVVVARVG